MFGRGEGSKVNSRNMDIRKLKVEDVGAASVKRRSRQNINKSNAKFKLPTVSNVHFTSVISTHDLPVCIVNIMKEAQRIHVASSQIQPSPAASPSTDPPPVAVPLPLDIASRSALLPLDPLFGEA